MKFEIDSNKLEQVIFRYLDNNLVIKETPEYYYFLDGEDSEYADIRLDKNDLTCLIGRELCRVVEDFFSIKFNYSLKFIVKYIKSVLNIKDLNVDLMPYQVFVDPF